MIAPPLFSLDVMLPPPSQTGCVRDAIGLKRCEVRADKARAWVSERVGVSEAADEGFARSSQPPFRVMSYGEWEWQAEHSLYFNPLTQIWAAPQPDGTWRYSDPVQSSSAVTLDNTTPPEAEDYEDGELPYEPPPPERAPPAIPLARLVVKKSAILPPAQTVATLDPDQPLTLGRDKSFSRILRLKELPVSKTHATVFWSTGSEGGGDHGEGHWAVADFGSTHGTHVKRGSQDFNRLSEAKVASGPFALQHEESVHAHFSQPHLELTAPSLHSILKIGTTSFVVHIHPALACSTCALAPDSSNLIPLDSPAPSSSSVTVTASPAKPFAPASQTMSKRERTLAVRARMRNLKMQYSDKAA